MIKKLLAACIFFTLIVSCNNSSKKEAKKEKKKISKRDYSINASNAYSDIFFDSMQLVNFLAENKVDEDLSRRMISFYNVRNYQYAWFSTGGLTEQARGFGNIHNYQTNYAGDSTLRDKNLKVKMDDYSAEEDGFIVSAGDKNIFDTELNLTRHFIIYTLNNYDKVVKRKLMERFIPVKKIDPLVLADSLLTKRQKDIEKYEEANKAYKLLREKLEQYVAIAKKGGWQQITSPPKLRLQKGSTSPLVLQVKARLQLTGDMAADTSNIFNDAMEAGIKNFQSRYGYSPTGMLTEGLIKDMNVPVLNRIKQILLNMGRMQWMINEPEGQLIVVNIPEFILHVKEGTKKVFDMNVVVGKEGHNTMMFTGNLNQVVFSPYWNVPPSIVKNELMPLMAKDPNYLARHNMEITSDGSGLPEIRQLPGEGNSLGKVKFLFPNSFNIYFHDTPAKSLFEKDKRAYSHGCIRLSDPVKMANYLLKDDGSWSPEKIDAAMNTGNEKSVKLKNPVPVLITYYTAWVDENGQLHFADDIYAHDKALMEKMFIN